ncbi:hypothetical protein AUC31_13035 [Planococcus rifietoensis]|uniref:Uncharacterized protein n=1 Tax=Planococcus rifietoensis TaxID=200991 RepID=A0A0U2XGV5_9BACL|nr:hypothetical protein AUC31_13035 [Planococcus rifietoensis]
MNALPSLGSMSILKPVAAIIIRKTIELPFASIAAENIFLALLAMRPRAAAIRLSGRKSSSTKKPFFAEHAATSCPSVTISIALLPARVAPLLLTPAVIYISTYISKFKIIGINFHLIKKSPKKPFFTAFRAILG